MSAKESKESAVPLAVNGLSIRDWFAGQALQGLISSRLWGADGKRNVDNMLAIYSYKLADAMLMERAK